jgi:WD40 repeat protein
MPLASASDDGTVKLWDPDTGTKIHILTGHTGKVNGVCQVQTGGRTLLASASHDGTVKLWDPDTGRLSIDVPIPWSAHAVTWIEDHHILAIGHEQGILAITLPPP